MLARVPIYRLVVISYKFSVSNLKPEAMENFRGMCCCIFKVRTRAVSGNTAIHIAASRGQLRFCKKICWALYHKSGGDSDASTAFSLVRETVNAHGGKRGQGAVDLGLACNVELGRYLKEVWGGVEQVKPPNRKPW